MLCGPLEQFENFIILTLPAGLGLNRVFPGLRPCPATYDLSIAVFSLAIVLFSGNLFERCHLSYLKLIPTVGFFSYIQLSNLFNSIFTDLIASQKGRIYFYSLFTFLFLAIGSLNMLALIPYTFALTSHFFFTFFTAATFFLSLNSIGIFYHGIFMTTLFYPSGTPFLIVPFPSIIECISYIARMFSLAIRLFANITAGHIPLKILAWFAYILSEIFIIGLVAGLLITILWGLEFFIAFLQAYVFVILLCIYLVDVLILH